MTIQQAIALIDNNLIGFYKDISLEDQRLIAACWSAVSDAALNYNLLDGQELQELAVLVEDCQVGAID